MAIGTPVLVGTVNTLSSTTTSVVTVTGGTINAGDLVFAIMQRSTFPASVSMTDTAGNTYTSHVQRNESVDASGVALLSGTAASVPTSITLTFGSGFAAKGAQVYSVSGVASPAIDTTGSTASSFPHTQPMTASAATTVADEIIVGGFDYDGTGTTATAGTNYTGLTSIDNTLQVSFGAYRIVSATATHSPLASTGTTGSSWSAVAGGFQASAGGGGGAAAGASPTFNPIPFMGGH